MPLKIPNSASLTQKGKLHTRNRKQLVQKRSKIGEKLKKTTYEIYVKLTLVLVKILSDKVE